MKNLIRKIIKSLGIGIFSVALATAGIDAADHYDNYSDSLAYRMIFGAAPAPCPADMVFISTDQGGFCLDKYENSAGENCPYAAPVTQDETLKNLENGSCKPVSQADALPWANISLNQAIQACAKAGKRLPNDEEWYNASLGTPDKQSDWNSDDCQVASNWINQPGHTGSGSKCISGMGAYDMVGNVWEWVKAEISDGSYEGKTLPASGYVMEVDIKGLPVNTSPSPDPNHYNDYLWIKDKGVRGMARGGYWDNKSDAGQFAVYLVSPPNFAGSGVGFRCAK